MATTHQRIYVCSESNRERNISCFHQNVALCWENWLHVVTLPTGGRRSIKYCIQCVLHVCLSVCLYVCLSRQTHISKTTCSHLTKFSEHVTCGRSSVIVWWHCNTLCTSGFVDVVMFSQRGTYIWLQMDSVVCGWGRSLLSSIALFVVKNWLSKMFLVKAKV